MDETEEVILNEITGTPTLVFYQISATQEQVDQHPLLQLEKSSIDQSQKKRYQMQKLKLFVQLQERQNRMLSLWNEIPLMDCENEFSDFHSQLIQQQAKCEEHEKLITASLIDQFRQHKQQEDDENKKKRKFITIS